MFGTNLQASQAVFCFLGGGRVLASSWIWFCMDWFGRKTPVAATKDNKGGEEGMLGTWLCSCSLILVCRERNVLLHRGKGNRTAANEGYEGKRRREETFDRDTCIIYSRTK